MARELPKPKVRVKVTGKGRKRTLRYTATARKGLAIKLFERMGKGGHQIGTITKSRGNDPLPGGRRPRRPAGHRGTRRAERAAGVAGQGGQLPGARTGPPGASARTEGQALRPVGGRALAQGEGRHDLPGSRQGQQGHEDEGRPSGGQAVAQGPPCAQELRSSRSRLRHATPRAGPARLPRPSPSPRRRSPRARSASRRSASVPFEDARQLATRPRARQPELCVGVGQVRLDGLLADHELLGDGTGRRPLGGQPGHP